jgi:hypothetical protein
MKVSSLLGAKRTKFKTALAMEATLYIPVGIRRPFFNRPFSLISIGIILCLYTVRNIQGLPAVSLLSFA